MTSGDERPDDHHPDRGGATDGDRQDAPRDGTNSSLEDIADPGEDLLAPSDVPTGLRVTFWTLVFVLKFAIIATSLGILFVAFQSRWQLGGGLVGLGLVLFAFAVVRYRRFRSGHADDAADETMA